MTSFRCVLAAAFVLASCTTVPEATARVLEPASPQADTTAAPRAEASDLPGYLRSRGTTGFVVIQDGRRVINETWPAPRDDQVFANFVHGASGNGSLLEDVASLQKSVVAVLVAIAIDKGLIDPEASVATYLGEGWSKASPDQEAAIRVVDIMAMASGLDEGFAYVAPPGTIFFYNTPVYAITQRIVSAAARQPLDVVTRDWLSDPVGLSNTDWRTRPAALASAGNDTGLVTTPGDLARLGLMILNDGLADDGSRVVSQTQLDALFTRSAANPAYGRLWWLNGSDYAVRITGRVDGQLIPAAPDDLVSAFGALDRRLYISRSRNLVVVRTGAATGDRDFDQQLWLRLVPLLD